MMRGGVVSRNLPAAIGFALALAIGAYLHARTADRERLADPPASNSYIVNQTICLGLQAADANGACKPVGAVVGSMIMVQLPANPASWTIASLSPNLVQEGRIDRLPNPGRYQGTSELYQWRFLATGAGDATLVMRETPRTISPSGTFTYTFRIR